MLSPPHPGRQLLSSPFRCDLGKGLYRISAQPPQPAERSAGLCSGSVESSERLLSSRGGWVCEILKGPKKAVWKQPRNSGPRAGSRVLKGQGYRGPLRQSKPTPCVFRDPSYRSVLPVGSAVCFALLSLDSSTQFGSRFSKIENGREGPVLLGLISPPLPPSLFRLMLPEEPPSAPPKNIVASGRTNQSIMVQWQPPPEPEHNGALRGYVLRQVPRPARALVASPGPVLLRPQAQTSAGAQR